MEISVSYIIELLGIAVFTISGAFSAMQKRLDVFGVLIIGFVTALGGGIIRDVMIGYTPVTWMRDPYIPLIILLTGLATMFLKNRIKRLKRPFVLFDALGLGLFTVIGIQKGVAAGLRPEICIILGTITGSFGGVLRDILLNNVPQIFRKEIYATACIIGGIAYFALIGTFHKDITRVITITLVCSIRLVAVRYNFSMPRF